MTAHRNLPAAAAAAAAPRVCHDVYAIDFEAAGAASVESVQGGGGEEGDGENLHQ